YSQNSPPVRLRKTPREQQPLAMLSTQYALQHPTRTLLSVFVAWKAVLLLIAAGSCVGPTYDTSSGLLLSSPDGRLGAFSSNGTTAAGDVVGLFLRRLTSWDAIYFVQVSRRGYLFEQEWAFGSGLPLVIAAVGKGG
ncbi:MAG: mannosyltransferase family protein, partial [Thaumarchaeota archaeon]|nr:mannosyltransferase family protein [Nitrososphaerota archaeon]